jgi:hypothetical protein
MRLACLNYDNIDLIVESMVLEEGVKDFIKKYAKIGAKKAKGKINLKNLSRAGIIALAISGASVSENPDDAQKLLNAAGRMVSKEKVEINSILDQLGEGDTIEI